MDRSPRTDALLALALVVTLPLTACTKYNYTVRPAPSDVPAVRASVQPEGDPPPTPPASVGLRLPADCDATRCAALVREVERLAVDRGVRFAGVVIGEAAFAEAPAAELSIDTVLDEQIPREGKPALTIEGDADAHIEKTCADQLAEQSRPIFVLEGDLAVTDQPLRRVRVEVQPDALETAPPSRYETVQVSRVGLGVVSIVSLALAAGGVWLLSANSPEDFDDEGDPDDPDDDQNGYLAWGGIAVGTALFAVAGGLLGYGAVVGMRTDGCRPEARRGWAGDAPDPIEAAAQPFVQAAAQHAFP